VPEFKGNVVAVDIRADGQGICRGFTAFAEIATISPLYPKANLEWIK
jgi:hypothetical protein